MVTKISKWSGILDSCRITPQNLITGSLCHARHTLKISERSVHNFLSYLCGTQTNRQTKTGKNITSLAKVIKSKIVYDYESQISSIAGMQSEARTDRRLVLWDCLASRWCRRENPRPGRRSLAPAPDRELSLCPSTVACTTIRILKHTTACTTHPGHQFGDLTSPRLCSR